MEFDKASDNLPIQKFKKNDRNRVHYFAQPWPRNTSIRPGQTSADEHIYARYCLDVYGRGSCDPIPWNGD